MYAKKKKEKRWEMDSLVWSGQTVASETGVYLGSGCGRQETRVRFTTGCHCMGVKATSAKDDIVDGSKVRSIVAIALIRKNAVGSK